MVMVMNKILESSQYIQSKFKIKPKNLDNINCDYIF